MPGIVLGAGGSKEIVGGSGGPSQSNSSSTVTVTLSDAVWPNGVLRDRGEGALAARPVLGDHELVLYGGWSSIESALAPSKKVTFEMPKSSDAVAESVTVSPGS